MLHAVLALGALLGAGAAAQTLPGPAPRQQAGQPAGGASTAGVFAPVKDRLARPITAGGFVDGAPVIFDDRTRGSGLDTFKHVSGSPEKQSILESPSGGVAVIDIDNDGWLDIYLLNGATTAARDKTSGTPRAALFRNNRDLTFTDITARAGLANERWGFGVAAGDVDRDGWTDLYVTNYGRNRLDRNNGDGTFSDIAERMGVAGDGGWSTGASFGDYDRDGDLDLFVAGYVDLDPPRAEGPGEGAGARTPSCTYRGERVMCGPRGLKGAADHLYRNEGARFVDVTAPAGVADATRYYGFAAAWADVDDDGWLDLLVVNDSTPNYLYRNRGDGTFEEIGFPSGFALNEEGREQAGMGLALGDYDNDGDLDSYITNFSDDSNTLRRNDGRATFTDVTTQSGLRTPTLPFLGWGTAFLDADNDGWLDLFVANGHVYPQVDAFDWGMTWAQRPLLFRNRSGARFEEVPAAPGSGLAVVVPARGAAFGDLDRDGRVDIVMNNHDRTPTLLRNVSAAAAAGHWISLQLKSARGGDALGAVVTLQAGDRKWRRDVISGASYCSQSDLRVHVGLGDVTRVDSVTVRWPNGRREVFHVQGVDRFVTLVEGQERPRDRDWRVGSRGRGDDGDDIDRLGASRGGSLGGSPGGNPGPDATGGADRVSRGCCRAAAGAMGGGGAGLHARD